MSKFIYRTLNALTILGFVALGIAYIYVGDILPVQAQTRPDSSQKSYHAQTGTLLNSSATSADDTAIVVTLTGVAGQQVHLYGIDAVCAANTSSITVDDEATEVYSLAIATVQERIRWEVPLTAGVGNDLVVTLATCGSSTAGVLSIQADQY